MNDSRTDGCVGRWDHASDRKRLARRVLVLSAAFVAQACGGGATAPAPVTLSGTVALGDSWANALDDFSGVAVTVDGLAAQAVTDKAGAWSIDGVPTGHHDLTFKKATFGEMRIPALNVVGPTMTVPPVTLTVPPWEQAVIDSIRVGTRSGKDYYFVDGHLAAAPPPNAKAAFTVVFIGRTAAVSPDQVTSFDQWSFSIDGTGKSQTFSAFFAVDAARSKFGAGSHAFAAAYMVSAICGCYTDPTTQKTIFTSTGPRANVVSLAIQ